MAPSGRGRPRGRGETRMDAALDAMSVMGFKSSVIRKKVNELLKVYGGPDGWVFIEEASYKLLIEELLRGQDGSEPGPPLLKGDSSNQDNMHGDAGSSSAAGPPNTTNTSPLMDAAKTCADGNSLQDSALTSADDVSYPQYDLLNSAENGFPPQIDHSPPPSPSEIRQTPMPPLPSPPPPPPPPPPDSDFVPPPPPPPLPPPPPPPPPPAGPTTPSSRKRKPCFGWWGEETEIIHLPLMPVPLKRACQRPVNAR